MSPSDPDSTIPAAGPGTDPGERVAPDPIPGPADVAPGERVAGTSARPRRRPKVAEEAVGGDPDQAAPIAGLSASKGVEAGATEGGGPVRRPRARKPAQRADGAAGAVDAPRYAVAPAPPSIDADAAASGHGVVGAPAEAPGAQGASGLADAVPAEGEARRRKRHRRRGRRGKRQGLEGETGMLAEQDTIPADDAAEGVGGATSPARTSDGLPPTPRLEPGDPGEWFAQVVDGRFDAAVDDPSAGHGHAMPPRRVLPPDPEAPKLHKVLAQAGVGSRRDLEQMIVEGRVSVNGQPAHTGQRIAFGDRVAIDGKPVRIRIAPPPPRVIAYHKPVGEVVTHDDPQHRPTVFRRLPRLPRGKWQSVGRLDINTEGLLLFTNSGDLANRLMHPRFGIEREYAVRVLGRVDDAARQRLLEGVDLDGQSAAFRRIEDGGGEGANHWYRAVIAEGRHREVRRLFEAVGLTVSRLIRIRYGSMVLPRGLRRGAWVDLPASDIQALQRAAGPPEPATEDGRHPGRRGGRRARGGRDAESMPAQRQRAHGRPADFDEEGEGDIVGPIPNPLMQTYDKRAIQQARRLREGDDEGPIPNPLIQTFDRRAAQAERRPRHEPDEDGPIPNPLMQTYDKRFAHAPRGQPAGPKVPGKGRRKPPSSQGRGPKPAAPGGQPDPMRTSVGYIGADAFLGKGKGRGPGGKAGKGGRRR